MLHALFVTISLQVNLPTNLLESVCYVESTHRVSVIHRHDGHGDSLGICQIKLNSARMVGFKGTAKELMRPSTNIYYAALYLKHQIDRYHSTKLGVIAYNIGHTGTLTSSAYQRKVYKVWYTRKDNGTASSVAAIHVDVAMKGQPWTNKCKPKKTKT